MSILARYITREIGKYFAIILIVVMGIYLTVDFIERIDNFMEVGVPLQRAGYYFFCKLPLILIQITPVGVLLSVLITFGLMGKNNELIALRGSGISLVSLVGPIARCGLAGTLLVFLLAEGIAPFTLSSANQIWLHEVKGQKRTKTHQQDIWLKADQEIIHVSYYHQDSMTAKGITFCRFDRQFKLEQRIDAQEGVYRDGQWTFHKGILQQRSAAGNRMDVSLFEDREVSIGITPEDLEQVVPQTEEMGFLQLYRYVQKVEGEGYDATRYKVDLQAKIAFPMACIIMTLMGAGLAARGKIGAGMAISIIYGIGIAFIYWIVYSFCMSLGYAGRLPPFVAAWAVNFISLCAAAFLLINAD